MSTMEEELAAQRREAGGGTTSDPIAERRRRLREALIAGCVANAEEDLAICREWAAVDAETARRVDGAEEGEPVWISPNVLR